MIDSKDHLSDHELLFSSRTGIREYALISGKSTEELLRGVIVGASEKLIEIAKEKSLIPTTKKTEEIVRQLAPPIVAEITVHHMSSGLSIPRVFFGGKYELADVIKAVSCIDATVFIKEVLYKGFGIKSEIKTIRLGVVKDHHYLQLETGARIDPIVRSRKNHGGYFADPNKHQFRVDCFNSGGVALLRKQITNIIFPIDSK